MGYNTDLKKLIEKDNRDGFLTAVRQPKAWILTVASINHKKKGSYHFLSHSKSKRAPGTFSEEFGVGLALCK